MNHVFSRVIAYCGYNIIYMNIIIYLRDYLFMHARSVRKEFMKNEKSSVHPTLYKKKAHFIGINIQKCAISTATKNASQTTKPHFKGDKAALYQRQSATLPVTKCHFARGNVLFSLQFTVYSLQIKKIKTQRFFDKRSVALQSGIQSFLF